MIRWNLRMTFPIMKRKVCHTKSNLWICGWVLMHFYLLISWSRTWEFLSADFLPCHSFWSLYPRAIFSFHFLRKVPFLVKKKGFSSLFFSLLLGSMEKNENRQKHPQKSNEYYTTCLAYIYWILRLLHFSVNNAMVVVRHSFFCSRFQLIFVHLTGRAKLNLHAE